MHQDALHRLAARRANGRTLPRKAHNTRTQVAAPMVRHRLPRFHTHACSASAVVRADTRLLSQTLGGRIADEPCKLWSCPAKQQNLTAESTSTVANLLWGSEWGTQSPPNTHAGGHPSVITYTLLCNLTLYFLPFNQPDPSRSLIASSSNQHANVFKCSLRHLDSPFSSALTVG